MITTTVRGKTWKFSHSVGCLTTGGEGFLMPVSIATSESDTIYVISRGPDPLEGDGNRLNQGSLKRIGKWRVQNEEYICDFGKPDIFWPVSIAVDSHGYVYCSEESQHKILKYDSDGLKVDEWGELGTDIGTFSAPAGLAFDSDDNMYIVDAGNHRIQKCSPAREIITVWGSQGSGNNQFEDPWGITIDNSGLVYVADWGNNRVQKFTPDGEYLQTFGLEHPEELKLNHPSDVAVDSDGDVYITDWGNKRVQIFDADGEVLCNLHGDAIEFNRASLKVFAANPDYRKGFDRASDRATLGLFDRPVGITIDENNRILICETNRCRVQVYDKLKDYSDAAVNL